MVRVKLRYFEKAKKTDFRNRIPGFLQGRGLVPDVYLRVPLFPLQYDYECGLYPLQQHGKAKLTGPLYQLTIHEDPEGIADGPVPSQPVRAQPMGMLVHPLSDKIVGVIFVYRPEDKPVRVRVPLRYFNEEKCIGLRMGGWVNRIRRAVDIHVAVNMRPPVTATHDLAGLVLKGRKTVGELSFKGKGVGCRAVLPDSEVTTIISKV